MIVVSGPSLISQLSSREWAFANIILSVMITRPNLEDLNDICESDDDCILPSTLALKRVGLVLSPSFP